MRSALAAAALGVAGLLLEGALAALVPVHWVPDFGLLVVVAAALVPGPAEWMVLAVGLGLGADMLSGALLGQQAALRLLELTATRLVAAQLDLRRSLPLAVFTLALSAADLAGMAGLTRLFLGRLDFQWVQLGPLVLRCGVNAVAAPLVAAVVRGVVERLRETEARREMRLDTRRPAL